MDTEREIYIALDHMKKRYNIALLIMMLMVLAVLALEVRPVWMPVS